MPDREIQVNIAFNHLAGTPFCRNRSLIESNRLQNRNESIEHHCRIYLYNRNDQIEPNQID